MNKITIKKFQRLSLLLLSFISYLGLGTANAQVGIGTISPDASAQLELQSTAKGFLPPRMDTDARDGIDSPAEGLTIYNTDNKCLEVFDSADWISICDGSVVTSPPYSESYVHCDTNNPTEIVEVISTTGKIWMDRNLGASQVSTQPRSDFNDDDSYITSQSNSFGGLFQWGRFADGHQCRDASLYDGASDRPNTITESGVWDGKFIKIPVNTNRGDWVTTKTDNAWNTGTTVNPIKTATDPCPDGFRLPTESELNAELESWETENNSDFAFNSILKLPTAGFRNYAYGEIQNINTGHYWSSTTSSNSESIKLQFSSENGFMSDLTKRAIGYSVRCIKD